MKPNILTQEESLFYKLRWKLKNTGASSTQEDAKPDLKAVKR